MYFLYFINSINTWSLKYEYIAYGKQGTERKDFFGRNRKEDLNQVIKEKSGEKAIMIHYLKQNISNLIDNTF